MTDLLGETDTAAWRNFLGEICLLDHMAAASKKPKLHSLVVWDTQKSSAFVEGGQKSSEFI